MSQKTTGSPTTGGPVLMNLPRAQKLMGEAGIDGLVATSGRNLYYTSEYPCFDYIIEAEMLAFAVVPREKDKGGYLIIPAADRLILNDFPSWLPNKMFFGNYYVKGAPEWNAKEAKSAVDGFVQAIHELGLAEGRIGLELELIPAGIFEEIKKTLPKATFKDGSPLFQQLRRIKSPEEIARLRKAAQAIDKGVRTAFAAVRPGMTEKQVEQIIHKTVVDEGCHVLYIQVGTNGRGAFGAVYPSDAVIKEGDAIRVDASAIFKYYTSDICRSCMVGEPTPEQLAYYDVTYRAEMAAIKMIKPGVKVSDLFKAAVEVPLAAGYMDFWRHHIGHGIGLQTHEWPFLKPDNDEVLQENYVLCIEVPYYIYGLGGFAPEDVVWVTKDGYEILSTPAPEMIRPAGK